MRFKTKDLLVTVLPKLEVDAELAKCYLHTRICLNPTICQSPSQFCRWPTNFCGPCSQLISCLVTEGCGFARSCGPGGSACDPTIFCAGTWDPWVIDHLEDLVAIRAELKETVAQLDALEEEGLPSSIKSRAEAEELERSLTEALEQVRAQKKKLK
jgi:hypothetical protein